VPERQDHDFACALVDLEDEPVAAAAGERPSHLTLIDPRNPGEHSGMGAQQVDDLTNLAMQPASGPRTLLLEVGHRFEQLGKLCTKRRAEANGSLIHEIEPD
jgi:hypothetical protein